MTSLDVSTTVHSPSAGVGTDPAGAVDAGVVAIVVTAGPTPFLGATLEAVRGQTQRPDTLIVVDVAATESLAGYHGLHLGDALFVAAPQAKSFGQAVLAGLAAAPSPAWLWLLHDDCVPEPDVLARLLRAVEYSASVAIAGPKQRRLSAGGPSPAGRLIEVGFTTSPLGRRMTGIDDDEIDQGQHDGQDDVLAVGLTGSIVRREVWEHLAGPDPELGPFGDSLDLCRRARLAGHRVIVVPQAVVHHAQASLLGLRAHPDGPPDAAASFAPRRRAAIHARLTSVALLALPVVALATLLAGPFRAVYRLAIKEPGHARDELLAPVIAVARLGPLVGARRRAGRTRRLPRRALRPLIAGWRRVALEHRDARLAHAGRRVAAQPLTDLDRAELRVLATRRRGTLAAVTVALAGVTAWVFGPMLGILWEGGRLQGGGLLPAALGVGDTWHAATDGVGHTGLGLTGPADPFALVLAVGGVLAGGSPQTAVDLLWVAGFLVAGLGAWFAAGAVTRSTAMRAWAVLLWTAAPVLTVALGSGRVGAVLVHATLPWFALGVVRALGLQRTDLAGLDRAGPAGTAPVSAHIPTPAGSLGAAAAAGLVLAVLTAGSPVLLPVAVVALAVIAPSVRHHRRYLLLIPVPALVCAAPLLMHAVRTWQTGGLRLLPADPGAPVPSQPAEPWRALLGHVTTPGAWFDSPDSGPWGTVTGWAPYGAGAVLLLVALVAVVRGRRAAAPLWLLAALGLATAGLAGASVVARTGNTPVPGWAGVGGSVALLALIALALLGVPRLVRPDRRVGRAAVGLAVVVAVALPAGNLVSWILDAADGDRVGTVRAIAEPVVPAVGQQLQAPPRAARVLTLEPDADGSVRYAALRDDGPQLADSSVVAHGLALTDPDVAQGALPQVTAQLVGGISDEVVPQLTRLGVGAVLVPASVPASAARADLVAHLDLVPGLERVNQGQADVVWRVAGRDTPAWAWLQAGTASKPVWSDGCSVDVAVEPADPKDPAGEDRTVVLAQMAAPGWVATLDGRRLAAVEQADGLQAFLVGADGGRLRVTHAFASRAAWLGVGVVMLLIYVPLAIPVRRRRAGGR